MSNIRLLLDNTFNEAQAKLPAGLDKGQQFEVFCSDLIFRDLGWSYADIQSGIVDGDKDGGIDAIFLLVNGALIQELDDFVSISSGIEIRLIILQAKHSDSTEEAVIDRLYQHIDWVLDLTADQAKLALHLNADVIEKIDLFKEAMNRYGTKNYSLSIELAYCSRGDEPTDPAKSLANKLEKRCLSYFPNANADFEFYGCRKLYEIATSPPSTRRELHPIGGGIIAANNDAFITLVTLDKFLDFITDGDTLVQSLFEFNVRDYEGDRASVNSEMSVTLNTPKSGEDFWWFNNGITIICSNVEQQSQKLVVQNPMIVNGLQTSNVIYENRDAFKGKAEDGRSLLVRLVKLDQTEAQERVIKATNSQNSLKPLALKATDQTQKDIENFLVTNGVFYERRKNYYKNLGKPAKDIIDIARLGQAVMALRMHIPHQSRGRPGSYLKNDKNYNAVFPPNADYKEYVVAAKLERRIDEFLSSHRSSYLAIYRNNLRFHLLMVAGWALAGKKKFKLTSLKVQNANDEFLRAVFNWIVSEFVDEGAEDATAKDETFTQRLKSNWTSTKTEIVQDTTK